MAESEIRIKITVNDQEASKRLQSFGQKLRETGERVSQVGMRLSAAFTLPAVALARMVLQNEQVAKTLEPVRAKFSEVGRALADAMLPVIQDLIPSLMKLADTLARAISWFDALPLGAKKAITGMVAFSAAIGPVLFAGGQLIGLFGTVAQLLGMAGVGVTAGAAGAAGAGAAGAGLAGAFGGLSAAVTGFGAAVAGLLIPLGVFVAALLVLDKIVKETIGSWPEAFNRAATAARQLMVLGNWLIGGPTAAQNTMSAFGMRANGGAVLPGGSYIVGERGPELLRMGTGGGEVLPMGGGRTGGGVTLVYSPAVSVASQREAETVLLPYLRAALRKV